MDPKPKPNRRLYIETLGRMTPEQRLNKTFELIAFVNSLFRTGLRRRFPEASEQEVHAIYLKRLAQCHNRNY